MINLTKVKREIAKELYLDGDKEAARKLMDCDIDLRFCYDEQGLERFNILLAPYDHNDTAYVEDLSEFFLCKLHEQGVNCAAVEVQE